MNPIVCTRADCNTEIDLIKENLRIVRPEVPLISAICPVCSASQILTKEVSIELADLHFKEEIPIMIQEKDREEEEDMLPSVGIQRKVSNALDILGYKGKKWNQKVKAILEFVRDVPMYQNPQGLYQLLAAWGVDSMHIPMVINRVFGSADMQSVSPYGNQGQMNTMYPFSYPSQNPMGTPAQQPGGSNQVGGYSMTQTPQGQVILIPNPQQNTGYPVPYPQQPIIIDRGNNNPPTKQDSIQIREKVDGDGKVTERIIEQPVGQGGATQIQQDPTQTIANMLSVLKDMGVISQGGTQSPDSTFIERIENQRREDARDFKTAMEQQAHVIDALKEQIHTNEMNQLHGGIQQLADELHNLKNQARSTGLSDTQYKIKAQAENLETITGHVEQLGNKVIGPLVDLQKQQALMNNALMLRNLETQDGVPAGSYVAAAIPQRQPDEDEITVQKDRWRQKAEAARQRG